jgi:hypothetical protein
VNSAWPMMRRVAKPMRMPSSSVRSTSPRKHTTARPARRLWSDIWAEVTALMMSCAAASALIACSGSSESPFQNARTASPGKLVAAPLVMVDYRLHKGEVTLGHSNDFRGGKTGSFREGSKPTMSASRIETSRS